MTPRTRAFFFTLSPVLLASLSEVPSTRLAVEANAPTLASAGLLLASAIVPALLGRLLAVGAVVLAAVAHRSALATSPMLSLLGVVFGTGILSGALSGRRGTNGAVTGAVLGTLSVWLAWILSGRAAGTMTTWLLSASFAGTLGIAFPRLCLAESVEGDDRRARRGLRVALWTTGLLLFGLVVGGLLGWGVLGPMTMLIGLATTRRTGELDTEIGWGVLVEQPHRFLVATFAALCTIGTLFLALPQSSVGKTDLIDAAFTAVSGVCVTGLSVVDIGTRFTLLGQCVLLALIQVGGLGIMTFSALAYTWIGRRMTLRHEKAAQALLGADAYGSVALATRRIVIFTFFVEAVGAVLLSIGFLIHGAPLGASLFRGLFTAVCAFCNAGFSLHLDNLAGFSQDPFILHVVAALVVMGGLSPAAVTAIPRIVRPRGRPQLLRHLLPLLVTACLLVGGTIALLALEWHHTLAPFGIWDRLHNAWFQSVTLRTAGFHSVDFAKMAPATLTFCMIMMFIGGSPGGTAGGVKTTTFAVMVLGVIRAVRGGQHLTLFRRRVNEHSFQRATVVLTIALAGALGGTMAIQLTQAMPLEMAAFEVISALGTVGLSIGGTPRLDDVGKLIIMGCMFMGRVGGISLLMFFTSRSGRERWERPAEEIDVG